MRGKGRPWIIFVQRITHQPQPQMQTNKPVSNTVHNKIQTSLGLSSDNLVFRNLYIIKNIRQAHINTGIDICNLHQISSSNTHNINETDIVANANSQLVTNTNPRNVPIDIDTNPSVPQKPKPQQLSSFTSQCISFWLIFILWLLEPSTLLLLRK